MKLPQVSRRRFVQLASGIAIGLRPGSHAAVAGETTAGRTLRASSASVASLGDSLIRLQFDRRMRCRVSHAQGTRYQPLTRYRCSDFLVLADGRRITDFDLQQHATAAVNGVHGPGTRLRMTGRSEDGVEKSVDLELFDRYPGFVFSRVTYRNLSAATISVRGWRNGDFLIAAADARGGGAPGFWCFSGGSHADRRDWVQPVKHGFAQKDFLGMTASDYGGGTPIVDVWRRDCGLAVGHLELTPKLVSLPIQEQRGAVRIAVSAQHSRELAGGDHFDTLETFVAAHRGDYFATLDAYRRIMAERGIQAAAPPAPSYESIWCAWGYERACTSQLIEATLPKVQQLGLRWAVIDDGWQSAVGDWRPNRARYPRGDDDMKKLVRSIRSHALKPRLWFSPLSTAPGSDLLHDHTDMLLLDRDGAVQEISWWNSFYLCPAYAPTVRYTQSLVAKFIGDWGFAGLKIDGQHLNGVAPCFNPAHNHRRPEESVEQLPQFYRAMYETATAIDPEVVMELCPCGTCYSFFNFPYMNQAPASDPESSWQVRLKGKTLKALMGPSAAYSGDHVELSDHGDDFASTVGIGGIVSTKFTWPVDPKPRDSFLLTPPKEAEWRRWIGIYQDRMLPLGHYRGELYDIGFDRPEAHVVEKSGRLYYAFFADRWRGAITLRGLGAGAYRLRDYVNDRDLGTVSAGHNRLDLAFEHALLLEAIPA